MSELIRVKLAVPPSAQSRNCFNTRKREKSPTEVEISTRTGKIRYLGSSLQHGHQLKELHPERTADTNRDGRSRGPRDRAPLLGEPLQPHTADGGGAAPPRDAAPKAERPPRPAPSVPQARAERQGRGDLPGPLPLAPPRLASPALRAPGRTAALTCSFRCRAAPRLLRRRRPGRRGWEGARGESVLPGLSAERRGEEDAERHPLPPPRSARRCRPAPARRGRWVTAAATAAARARPGGPRAARRAAAGDDVERGTAAAARRAEAVAPPCCGREERREGGEGGAGSVGWRAGGACPFLRRLTGVPSRQRWSGVSPGSFGCAAGSAPWARRSRVSAWAGEGCREGEQRG